MIKARIRWCSSRVENILTLGKLLSLWFCFILCLLYLKPLIVHTNNFSYELARPIMGTIFLVIIIISMNKSQELTVFPGCQKLTSTKN